MSAFAAVVRRELAEYRLVLPAAVLIGVGALAAPWLPGAGRQVPAELRGAAAGFLAGIVSFVLAAVLGATVIARDLSERRLGFYFARPVPGWALWAGKMTAAVALVLAAGGLVLLPAWLAGAQLDPGTSWLGSQPVEGALLVAIPAAGSLAVLFFVHAVSTMVRARSPWLLLDLVAAFALAGVFLACRGSLLEEGALEALQWGRAGLLAMSISAAAAAGAVQVTRGRTDLRRGHRLLSLTLWTSLGLAVAGFAGYTAWVLHVTPQDLRQIYAVVPAPSGSWVGLTGESAGRGSSYHPRFLLDVESGRYLKTKTWFWDSWWEQPLFSADGRRAVWLDLRSGQTMIADLRQPRPRAVPSGILYQRFPESVALSPDGTRLAALADGRLTVDDLGSGRLLAAVALPASYGDRLRFLDDRRLRVIRSESSSWDPARDWQLSVRDLDLATGHLAEVSRLALPASWIWMVSPEGDRVLLRSSASVVHLVELSTGRSLATLKGFAGMSMRFLTNGDVAAVGWDAPRGRLVLNVLDRNGAELRRVALAGRRGSIGGQPVAGSLVVATAPSGPPAGRTWHSWWIDLATGRVRSLGQGLMPLLHGTAQPGSAASRLFQRKDGGVVLLDPAAGRFRSVLQPRR